MKRKWIAVLFALIVLAGMGVFGFWWKQMEHVNNFQPPRIMVGDTRYSYSGEMDDPPDSAPDGTIQEIIKPSAMPVQNGQANFSEVGAAYWIIPGGVAVEAHGRYFILR